MLQEVHGCFRKQDKITIEYIITWGKPDFKWRSGGKSAESDAGKMCSGCAFRGVSPGEFYRIDIPFTKGEGQCSARN